MRSFNCLHVSACCSHCYSCAFFIPLFVRFRWGTCFCNRLSFWNRQMLWPFLAMPGQLLLYLSLRVDTSVRHMFLWSVFYYQWRFRHAIWLRNLFHWVYLRMGLCWDLWKLKNFCTCSAYDKTRGQVLVWHPLRPACCSESRSGMAVSIRCGSVCLDLFWRANFFYGTHSKKLTLLIVDVILHLPAQYKASFYMVDFVLDLWE